jgi:hypothetical protein
MPFSTIPHENGSVNNRISAYTFVLTIIILCLDLECLLGVSGAKNPKLSNFAKFELLRKIQKITENQIH